MAPDDRGSVGNNTWLPLPPSCAGRIEPSLPCVRVDFTGDSGPPPDWPDDGGPPDDGAPPPLEPDPPPEPSEPPLDDGWDEGWDDGEDDGEDDGIEDGIVGDGVDPGVGIDTMVGRPRQPPSANAHGASQASLVLGVRVITPILPRPDRPRPSIHTYSLV